MKKIQTTVADHLQSREFNFNFNSERSFFDFGVEGNNGNWKVFIIADEQRRLLQIISVCPIRTPRQQQQSMCELLTRMNEDILLGKFSMDFENGEITFKTSNIYCESEISDISVFHLLQSNFNSFDEYLPAMIAVIYRHNQPLLAFIETQQSNESLN